MKAIAVSILIALLLNVGIVGQTPNKDKQAIEKVVRDSNEFEMALYRNPPDEELFQKFKGTVVVGGQRDEDVSGRIKRAREAGRKGLNVRHKIDELTFTEVSDNSAVVDTKESGGHEWSDKASPPFCQNHRRHTYYLIKDASGNWLIDKEVMHPATQAC